MKSYIVYNDDEEATIFYFRYLELDSYEDLVINIETNMVNTTNSIVPWYIDKEVTDKAILNKVRSLLLNYFKEKYIQYNKLANCFYSLSIGEFKDES